MSVITKKAVYLFITFWVLVSCTTKKELVKKDDVNQNTDFVESSLALESLISKKIPKYISGKARVLYNDRNGSERFIAQFYTNRTHTLYKIKNNLGIEALQLYITPDSVISNDRIEKKMGRFSRAEYAYQLGNSYVPLHLMNFLFPTTSISDAAIVRENDEFIEVKDEFMFKRILFSKKDTLVRIVETDLHRPNFTKAEIQNYKPFKGLPFPKKLSVSDANYSFRVTFLLTELETADKSKVIDPI